MKKIEFKEYTIADCNAIMEIISTLSFNNGVFSPVNADFFSKVYIYFLTTNIIDEYVSKNQDGSIYINDINNLYKYVYSSEIKEIINSDINGIEFCEIVNRYKDMADEAIEFSKQQMLTNRNSLIDISLSNLIDNINKVVSDIQNSVTSDDVKKLIESKDDIIKALTDIDRLDARLEKREKFHKENQKQVEKIQEIKKVIEKRTKTMKNDEK